MHSAPAVSYCLQRSRYQGWFLGLAWLSGAAVSACWLSLSDVAGWRLYVALACVVSAGILARLAWRQTPAGGLLIWDGLGWRYETQAASVPGTLSVHIDLQFFLLLSLKSDGAGLHWFWLDRPAVRSAWADLRRAIWSDASGKTRQSEGSPSSRHEVKA
jgi:hypothetical protein